MSKAVSSFCVRELFNPGRSPFVAWTIFGLDMATRAPLVPMKNKRRNSSSASAFVNLRRDKTNVKNAHLYRTDPLALRFGATRPAARGEKMVGEDVGEVEQPYEYHILRRGCDQWLEIT
jgi:hypothetical protein